MTDEFNQKTDLRLDEKPADSQEVQENSWFGVILEVPYVGDWIGTLLAVLPSILIIAFLSAFVDVESQAVRDWTIAVVVPLLVLWLLYLEKRIDFVSYLPFPVISVKLKWALIPFWLLWIYLMYAGETHTL